MSTFTPPPAPPEAVPNPLPSRQGQDQTLFDDSVEAFIRWFGRLATWLGDYIGWAATHLQELSANTQAVTDSAASAAASAATAQQAVAVAQAVAGAVQWAPGHYSAGDLVWSPANGKTYRARLDMDSSADPASDPAHWFDISAALAMPVLHITASTQATAGVHYVLSSTGITLTLPANPQAGDVLEISDMTWQRGNRIATSAGQRIKGRLFDEVEIDIRGVSTRWRYTGATDGWVI